MKRIVFAACCCYIAYSVMCFSVAESAPPQPPKGRQNNQNSNSRNKNNTGGPPGENRGNERGNENNNGGHSDENGVPGNAPGIEGRGGYFYSSKAYRLRKIERDGTLLLVSETKGYDWALKQYYDVLEKVTLLGVRLPKPGDVCYQEYFTRVEQLVADIALEIEYDDAFPASEDQKVRPAYLVTEDGQLINIQLIGEGYAALQPGLYYYYQKFNEAQQAARQEERGVWNAEKQCTAVPLAAIMMLKPASATSGKQDCKIKGLVSSNGKLKYCLNPGDKSYDAIKVRESKGERWFCTKEEARSAGWNCY